MEKLVRTGEIVIGHRNDILSIYGLGSCIALVIYDKQKHFGGMLHVLLPKAPEDSMSYDTRFANHGIKRLINCMIFAGSRKEDLCAKMVGGASFVIKVDGYSDIGKRNIESCRDLLRMYNIPLISENVGGASSRSVSFNMNSFEMIIKMDSQMSKII